MRPLLEHSCDGDECIGIDLSIAKAYIFDEFEGNRYCSSCAAQMETSYEIKAREENASDIFSDEDEDEDEDWEENKEN